MLFFYHQYYFDCACLLLLLSTVKGNNSQTSTVFHLSYLLLLLLLLINLLFLLLPLIIICICVQSTTVRLWIITKACRHRVSREQFFNPKMALCTIIQRYPCSDLIKQDIKARMVRTRSHARAHTHTWLHSYCIVSFYLVQKEDLRLMRTDLKERCSQLEQRRFISGHKGQKSQQNEGKWARCLC